MRMLFNNSAGVLRRASPIILAVLGCLFGLRNIIISLQSYTDLSTPKEALLPKYLHNNNTTSSIASDTNSSQAATADPWEEQCGIPENHTAMDQSWLRFVKERGWLPAEGLEDGTFAPEWYATLDCPAALKTLQWVDQSAGLVSCPPGATMWTFSETSTHPVLSTKSSQKLECDGNGQYIIPPGLGLLCGNSIRLRPKRNLEAIARAQGLMDKRREQDETKGRPPHILMYMMDAVSRPAFNRSLKATRRSNEAVASRASELGTNVFEFGRHHSVGGSSIRNLTPMLSGLLLQDMQAWKKQYQAWIFEEMRRSGYVVINTHNACSLPKSNTTFMNSSYGKNAVESYFPFQLYDIGWFEGLYCTVRKHDPSIHVEQACAKTPNDNECFASAEQNTQMGRVACLGGRSRATLMVEHYLHARADHDGAPSFAHLHDYDLHIENLVVPHMYDEDKARIMPMLAEADVFKDSVVIFLSDHGNQQEICTTTQGAFEHKLPFLYMFVPDTVLNVNPGWREALEFNEQVLTSPLDVHETMVHLAGGRGMGDVDWWKIHGHDPKLGGSSLLNRLPFNRSCADAGIPATECICGGASMDAIAEGSRMWNTVLTFFIPQLVEYMNSELAEDGLIPSVCRSLETGSLLSVASRRITERDVAYQARFSIVSPRMKPMEMFAVFSARRRGKKVTVDTLIQTSRFAHWVQHCQADVLAGGGNQHYCDCSRAPDGGWGLG